MSGLMHIRNNIKKKTTIKSKSKIHSINTQFHTAFHAQIPVSLPLIGSVYENFLDVATFSHSLHPKNVPFNNFPQIFIHYLKVPPVHNAIFIQDGHPSLAIALVSIYHQREGEILNSGNSSRNWVFYISLSVHQPVRNWIIISVN